MINYWVIEIMGAGGMYAHLDTTAKSELLVSWIADIKTATRFSRKVDATPFLTAVRQAPHAPLLPVEVVEHPRHQH